MGIIDCLSAGYRFLGRRVELLLIPILLDLLLWFGPQLSVAPLFDEAGSLYARMASVEGVTPEMGQMVQQLADGIKEMGKGSNLVAGLVSGTLLHVPSLLMTGSPAPSTVTIEITEPWLALVLWLSFSVLGVLIGVIYLGLLARRLPIGAMAGASASEFMAMVLRQWVQVIGFVVLLTFGLMLLYIPVGMAVGLLMLVNPALGSLAAAMAGGFMLIAFFYLCFVTPGLVMDNLPLNVAVVRSLRLVRDNFWPTLGFIVLSNFIGLGFALLLTQVAMWVPWGTLAGILANAYVGTGLSMALLVFYRSRLIKGEKIEQT